MRLAQLFCIVSSLVLATGAIPNLIGRSDGTVDAAKRWKDDLVLHQGKITVTAANGTSFGFVSKILSDLGTYVADLDKDHAACFSFNAKKDFSSKGLLLKDTTSNRPDTPYLGGVIPHGFSLSPRSGWKRDGTNPDVPTAGTGKTNPDVPPTSGGNSTTPPPPSSRRRWFLNGANPKAVDIESAIWTYNPSTKEFLATWTNPDGCAISTTPFYNPCSNQGVALVSDAIAYTFDNPDAFPISLHFLPN